MKAADSPAVKNSHTDDLAAIFREIMVKVGLRMQDYPTPQETAVMMVYVADNYPFYSLQEIRNAFDLMLQRKLDLDEKDIPCYGSFSCAYFSKVMSAYQRWAKTQVQELERNIIPLPAPREEMTDDTYLAWFGELAAQQAEEDMIPELLPVELYTWAETKGLITLDNSEKYEFIQQAIKRRQDYLRSRQDPGMEKFAAMVQRGWLSDGEADIVKKLAKRLIIYKILQLWHGPKSI